MAKYKYGWDKVNKKKVYMGKYSGPNLVGRGYYGNDEAGNNRYAGGGGEPDKRGFVGSDTKEYPFFNPKYGTRIITAQSFPEALRKAKSLGFTRNDYKKR